jgi:phosphoribosylglycinamide formyltransferase-1
MIISFLTSHGGSSMRYIIKKIEDGDIDATLGVIIVNNSNSEALKWAKINNYNYKIVNSKTSKCEDLDIKNLLLDAKTDLVILSGYMKKIKDITLNSFGGKILNIHPALLPKFGGSGMYGDNIHKEVIKSKDKESGASVHIVSKEYDAGDIISQQKVKISQDETYQSLRDKIKAIEPKLYFETIKDFIKNKQSTIN